MTLAWSIWHFRAEARIGPSPGASSILYFAAIVRLAEIRYRRHLLLVKGMDTGADASVVSALRVARLVGFGPSVTEK